MANGIDTFSQLLGLKNIGRHRMSNKTLSIIILNYKSWDLLANCIQSIEQHPPSVDYEVIAVDNDSQDGLFEQYGAKFPQVSFIVNKGNYGYSSGCNFAAESANGKYFVFLNPDTELTDSPALDTMTSYADSHADTGIISCRKIKPGNRLEREITFLSPWLTLGIVRSIYKAIFANNIAKSLPPKEDVWHPQWLTGSIFFVPKDVFQQIDGLSEQDYWMYFEEMDIAHKINKIHKSITLIRNVEIKHQHGGSSRINPRTAAITKSEVMISRHVYIQKFYTGINRILLHISMLSISLGSQLLMALISTPFFYSAKTKASWLLLGESVKYYWRVLTTGNYKSHRLKNNS